MKIKGLKPQYLKEISVMFLDAALQVLFDNDDAVACAISGIAVANFSHTFSTGQGNLQTGSTPIKC